MLDDMAPDRRRQVVRNAFREAYALAVLTMGLLLWLGLQTNVSYVDVSPQVEMLLDFIASLSLMAAGFLVWGRRAIEEGLELLSKMRGG